VRRYIKRNPHLVGYRRVWVPESDVTDAIAKLAPAGSLPAAIAADDTPAPAAKKHPGRSSIRSTKTDPNKRLKRARRKLAVRTLRRAIGKPGKKAGRKRHAMASSR